MSDHDTFPGTSRIDSHKLLSIGENMRALIFWVTESGNAMKLLACVLLVLARSPAIACSCSYSTLGDKQAVEASEIFVFRLVSAVADPESSDPFAGREVTAKINIVDVIRGKPRFETLHYSTSFCCGSKMDLGHYYVAFTSGSGGEFSGNTGNLLNLGEVYASGYDTSKKLRAIESGERTLEQEFGQFPNDKMHMLPAPPDPCPDVRADQGK
jgi:hypothetical protein